MENRFKNANEAFKYFKWQIPEYGIEFDDEGVADIWFVPIRPGRYEFGVKGFEDKGMRGFFNVE